MNTLKAERAPLMFAISGDEAIPGLQGRVDFARDAAGIVIVAARRFDRACTATLGAHIMSPGWRSTAELEERLEKVLRGQIEFAPAHRVPATLPLPPDLISGGAPIVVLTLNLELGLETIQAAGRALRILREEGIVMVALASSGGTSGSRELLGTMSLLLAAAFEDDRVADLGTRSGRLGFVLAPESHEAVEDHHSWWQADAAGEMPREIIDRLRPFMAADEDDVNAHQVEPREITW